MDNSKRSYEAPSLRFEGTVKDLTLGTQTGAFTDQAYPNNFPISQEKKSVV